jgi:hypothetical protein
MMPPPKESNRLTGPARPRDEHFHVVSLLAARAPAFDAATLERRVTPSPSASPPPPPACQLPPWPPPPPPASSTIAPTASPCFRLHRRRLLMMRPPSHGATVATSPTPLLQGRLFMAASTSNVHCSPRRHSRMVAVVAHVMVLCREIIGSDCERIRVSASSRDAL